MILDYVALVLLIVILALVIYGLVAIWGIPYEIAKGHDHPHQDAIGAATWVSLFTLGLLWPFLWIWALAYRPDRGWGFSPATAGAGDTATAAASNADLANRVTALERALKGR